MDNLYYFVNDDITTEILSHLPVKILLKFRSVSKSWRDIIDSSSLRNLHVQNQLSNNNNNVNIDDAVFLQLMPRPDKHLNGKLLKIMILDFPSYKDFLSNNNIDHSCVLFSGQVHGLICFYRNCSSNPIGLCNPILKEIKILPESPFPSCTDRHVGLGYDQDFKVVQLLSHFRQQRTVVEVYSRKQNKWREVGDHPLHRDILITAPVESSSSGGTFAHWYAIDLSAEATGTEYSRFLVVSFDMRNEALKTLRIPRFENAEKHDVLAEEDSLIVFVWPPPYPSGDQGLIMWEYKLSGGINNYSKSKREDWIKMGSLGPFNGMVWPLMWWKSGGLVLRLYSCKARCVKIVFYDCCSGQIVRCINHDLCLSIFEYNRPTFISP